MRRCCWLVLAVGLGMGCVSWPKTPEEPTLPPEKAVSGTARPTPRAVTPDQVTEANALQKSQELWDELDHAAKSKK